MSTISASTTSTTAYKVTADTTGALVLQTGATPTTAVTIDTSQNVLIGGASAQTGAVLAVTGGIQGTIKSGTSQSTTSGTSVTFSGIPSWAKRVTITPVGVSFAVSDTHRIQLVTSGGTVTTGYISSAWTPNTNNASSTTAFILLGVAQGGTFSGNITLTLSTGNTWVLSSCIGGSSNLNTSIGAGHVALGSALTGLVYSGSGGQTLNAGSINILYEG